MFYAVLWIDDRFSVGWSWYYSLKKSNNAQEGQSRVNTLAVNSTESSNASAARNMQNGAHVPPQLQGMIQNS